MGGINPIAIRYDPVAETVSATVNGASVGPFPAPGVVTRYAVMEGQGVLDNFVVRSVP